MTDELDDFDKALRHNEEVERREWQDQNGESNGGAPPSGRRHKKRLKFVNNIGFDEELFKIISDLASKEGVKTDRFIINCMSTLITDPDSILGSKDYKLITMNYRMHKYLEHRDSLRQAAAENQVMPEPELSDMIVEFADEAGWDADKFKVSVKNDTILQAMAEIRANPTSKRSRCRVWMARLLREIDGKILSLEANALASKAGFNKDTTDFVRRELGVRSAPDEKGIWYWWYGDKEKIAAEILSGSKDEEK